MHPKLATLCRFAPVAALLFAVSFAFFPLTQALIQREFEVVQLARDQCRKIAASRSSGNSRPLGFEPDPHADVAIMTIHIPSHLLKGSL